MNEVVEKMAEYIKEATKTSYKANGECFIVNNDFANKMKQCAKIFICIFKDYDFQIYTNLVKAVDSLFFYEEKSGVLTGNCIFNNLKIAYLDAAVDFAKSETFKNQLKVKKSKVFISHSSDDLEYVKPFVDMLDRLGLKTREHMFCSSVSGYNIPLNENIFDYLCEEFTNNNLYVILFLSKNYYSSSVCLNEMGAAWVLKSDYQAILLPKYNFDDINGAIDPQKICFKLDDIDNRSYRLTELKNKIVSKLELEMPDELLWERYKTEFFGEIDKRSNFNRSLVKSVKRTRPSNRLLAEKGIKF